MSTFTCPFDNTTKIIKIDPNTDSIYRLNGSTDIKFNHSNGSIKLPPNNETIDFFYKTENVWEFDNIGVSKPILQTPNSLKLCKIGNNEDQFDEIVVVVVRYLVCGSCDCGALGFAGYIDNKKDKLIYFFYL